ncbi:MAG: histidine kinase, partial [bacterium]|nr:histidine kinase [bacterium]
PHVGDCSQWTIAVADNGPGIDTKYHAKIFQTPASGNTGEHTGISLALVKKIIDVHGGTVRVASQPGKGSTFVITFPKITSH